MKIKLYIAILTVVAIGCNSVSQKDKDIYKYLEATIGVEQIEKSKFIILLNLDACYSCNDVIRDILYRNDNDSTKTILISSSINRAALLSENYNQVTIDKSDLATKVYKLIINEPVIYRKESKNKLIKRNTLLHELQNTAIQNLFLD